jgi:hypothetical protein
MTTTADPILASAGPTIDLTIELTTDDADGAPLLALSSLTTGHELAEPTDVNGTFLAQRSAEWRAAFAAVQSGRSVVNVIWMNDRTAPRTWNPHRVACRAEEERARGYRALAARRIPLRSGVVIDLSHLPSADVIDARETLIAVAADEGVHAVWMSSTRSLGDDADGARAFVRLLETGVRVILPHHTDNASSVLQLERSPDEAWER